MSSVRVSAQHLNSELVSYLRDGLDAPEIARRLELTEQMVEYISQSLVTKLGVGAGEGEWVGALEGPLDEGDSD